MIHHKQHLLYLLLLSFYCNNLVASLVSIAGGGSVANTMAYAAAQQIAESMGLKSVSSSTSSSNVPSSSDVMVENVSLEEFHKAFEQVMQEEASSSSSSSSENSNSAVVSQNETLREATEQVLHFWAKNQEMIKIISQAVPQVANDLVVIPSTSSVKAPTATDYQNALQYTSARQMYSFFFGMPGVILPSEIEILEPMTVNDLTVAVPAESAVLEFFPKQIFFFYINAINANPANAQVLANPALKALNVAKGTLGKSSGNKTTTTAVMLSEWCGIIKQYATSINTAIGQALAAQNAAEASAQGASNDIWSLFQQKYESVRKGLGILNFGPFKADPAINEAFKTDADKKFLQLYVEGALECLVYDMTIYSGIAKIEQDGCSDIVKYMHSKTGKELLYYMIFGAAVVGGAGALADDSEEGLRNRILIGYQVMKMQIPNITANPTAVMNAFAQSVFYIATGRSLILNPQSNAAAIKQFELAAQAAKSIVANPEAAVNSVPAVPSSVEVCVGAITPWQAYGLNYSQAPVDFMNDVYQVLDKSPNTKALVSGLQLVVSSNSNAASMIQASLLMKSMNANLSDKSKYYFNYLTNSVSSMGTAVVNVFKSTSSNVVPSESAVENMAQTVVTDAKQELTTVQQHILQQVDRGEKTVDAATREIQEIVGANAVIPQVVTQQLQELRQQEIAQENATRAQQEASKKMINDFGSTLLSGYEEMLNSLADDTATHLSEMKTSLNQGQAALNKQRALIVSEQQETEKIVNGLVLRQKITQSVPALLLAMRKFAGVSQISTENAQALATAIQKQGKIWGLHTPNNLAYLQGYAQALSQLKLPIPAAHVSASSDQVEAVVGIVQAAQVVNA